MNYELLRNLQEAEALSQELLLRLRRTQDQLPDMVGGELLKVYQQAATEAAAATERLHNQVLTLQTQAMSEP